MPFFRPRIEWTPDIIQGEAPIADDVRDVPAEQAVDETRHEVRDFVDPQDREIIDDYLNTLHDVEQGLDKAVEEIDKQLSDFVLEYNPAEQPLLDEACKCPYCGDPNSGNTITLNSFKLKQKARDRQNQAMSMIGGFDVGNLSPKMVASIQQQRLDQMMVAMLDSAWRQILIWILEALNSLLAPLRNVPIAKEVPDQIDKWIAWLSRNQSRSSRPIPSPEDFYRQNNPGKSMSIAGMIADYEMMRTMFCAAHVDNFDKYVYVLMQGRPEEPLFLLRSNILYQRKAIESTKFLADAIIPDKYTTPLGITFYQRKPDEYKKALASGLAPNAAFLKGSVDLLHKVKDSFLRDVDLILQRWVNSREVFCCLLRNLIGLGLIKKMGKSLKFEDQGKKALIAMRSILLFLRTDFSWRMRVDLTRIANLVIELINNMVYSLMSSLMALLENQFMKNVFKPILDSIDRVEISAQSHGVVRCLPWHELIAAIREAFKRFSKELAAYITAFYFDINAIYEKSFDINQHIKRAVQYDQWIYLIDRILTFMKVWDVCIETTGVNDLRRKLQNNLIMEAENDINNIYAFNTVGRGDGLTSRNTMRAANEVNVIREVADQYKDARVYEDGVGYIDDVGLQMLMTNFLGLSESETRAVIQGKGECSCDQAMTDEEIMEIKNSILRGES